MNKRVEAEFKCRSESLLDRDSVSARSDKMRLVKKLFAALLPLLLVVLFLSGCGGSPVVNNPPPTDHTKALVSITIDWDAFESDQILSAKSVEESFDVTSVGARLVYVDENASFSQSVSREVAEKEGIITLEVPPTQKANLLVAAVHEGSARNPERALYLGPIHDLVLQSGTVRNITVEDVIWVKAEWDVHDTHRDGYLTGSFFMDKSETRFSLPIRVRDPYQIGERPTRGRLAIKLSGDGYEYENTEGWRRVLVSVDNKVDIPSSSDERFWPYLDGSLFNLPETYYYIGDEGTFTVHWK